MSGEQDGRAQRRRPEQGRRRSSALQKAGFKAGIQEEYSDRVAQGFVSRQAPTAGTKLRKGATVDIWVSKGSQTAPALADFKGWTASAVDD